MILGDGECNEGSIWESAMFAPNNNLSNLNVIIDRNNFQQTGENKNIMDLRNLSDKWKSFGWDVFEINGHDINALNKYFENTNKVNSPKVLIANTLKGKGISFAENNNQWHHSILSENLYNDGIAELEKMSYSQADIKKWSIIGSRATFGLVNGKLAKKKITYMC